MERLRTLFGMLNSSVSTQTLPDKTDCSVNDVICADNTTLNINTQSNSVSSEPKNEQSTNTNWHHSSEGWAQPSNMTALREPPVSLDNTSLEALSNGTSKTDCIQCRIVGVSALTICTAYVLYHGPRTARTYKGRHKIVCTIAYLSLSAVTATLGICRLFDIGPFRTSNNDEYLRQKAVTFDKKSNSNH